MSQPLFSLKLGKRTFAPSLLPLLGFVLLFPVLINLGFWQLSRADEKRQIIENLELKAQQAEIPLEQALEAETPDYSAVVAKGQPIHDVHFVVDNQKQNGKLGYEIFAVWQLEKPLTTGEKYILVSRGWLPRKDFYQKTPEIPRFNDEFDDGFDEKHIQGNLYYSKGDNPVVAQNAQWQKVDGNWLIGQFDLQTIRAKVAQLGYDVAPFVIRQKAQLGSPFVRHWQVVASPPEKHIAYAIQWFGMGLVLVILFIILNLKRERKDESA